MRWLNESIDSRLGRHDDSHELDVAGHSGGDREEAVPYTECRVETGEDKEEPDNKSYDGYGNGASQ